MLSLSGKVDNLLQELFNNLEGAFNLFKIQNGPDDLQTLEKVIENLVRKEIDLDPLHRKIHEVTTNVKNVDKYIQDETPTRDELRQLQNMLGNLQHTVNDMRVTS